MYLRNFCRCLIVYCWTPSSVYVSHLIDTYPFQDICHTFRFYCMCISWLGFVPLWFMLHSVWLTATYVTVLCAHVCTFLLHCQHLDEWRDFLTCWQAAVLVCYLCYTCVPSSIPDVVLHVSNRLHICIVFTIHYYLKKKQFSDWG